MPQVKKKAILVCEECLSRNYTVSKSSSFANQRLETKKYCKTCDKHNLHKETR